MLCDAPANFGEKGQKPHELRRGEEGRIWCPSGKEWFFEVLVYSSKKKNKRTA